MSADPLVKDHRGLRRRPIYSPILLAVVSVVAGALLLAWLASGWGVTTVVLVRHAAKLGGTDPGLSAAGQARAAALAELLADAGLDAVYVSEARRTMETAEPTARRAGLTPVVVPADDPERLVERLKDRPSGDVVLVVGHSNTIPEIARSLGVDIGEIGEADYDGVWIVSVSRLRGARLVTLRY